MKSVAITGYGGFFPGCYSASKLFSLLYRGDSLLRSLSLGEFGSPVNVICSALQSEDIRFLEEQVAPANLSGQSVHITAKMALYAVRQALQHASLDETLLSKRVGFFTGCNKAIPSLQMFINLWAREKSLSDEQLQFIGKEINTANQAQAARYVAQALGLEGPAMTFADACTAGAAALVAAQRRIQAGELDVVICGGTEQASHPLMQMFFAKLGALSSSLPDDPTTVCRPFDQDRSGCLLADAAAFLVLESVEHAQRRNAPILAYLSGSSRQSEAHKMTATDSSGVFYAKAMQGALFDAGLEASDIQHINAHGTSTPLNDAAESRALEQVFYQQSFIPPTITSTKSALGHSLGATSAVEAVLSVESLRQQKVLPTLNYHRPGVNEPHLSIVTQGQPQALTRVLSNSFGFGGENASLIFSRGES